MDAGRARNTKQLANNAETGRRLSDGGQGIFVGGLTYYPK